jgi:hypothetical protein
VLGLAGHVARSPGEGRALAKTFLEGRDKEAAERMQQLLVNYIHGGDSMFATMEGLLEARSAAAAPLYKQAEGLQLWNLRLQMYLDDPEVQKGLAVGFKLERLASLAENREFAPLGMGVDLDAEGNIKILQKPSLRVLDMAKRGLDAMVAKERNEVTGRLSDLGRELERVRKTFVKEIDALDTKGIYKAARDAWSGPSGSIDAMNAGHSIFEAKPEETAALFESLSPSDQEFFRVGVADKIQERLFKVGVGGDEAKALIKNPWTRKQLAPVFRSEQEADQFLNSVAAESRMFETKYATIKNSLTAARRVEDEDPAHQGAARFFQLAKDVMHQHWVSVAGTLIKMRGEAAGEYKQQLEGEIARILFQTPLEPEGEVAQRLLGKYQPTPQANPLKPMAGKIRAATPYAATALTAPSIDRGTVDMDRMVDRAGQTMVRGRDGAMWAPDPNNPGKWLKMVP